MAQILLHTSSGEKTLQDQALGLQNELQLLGHTVDFSTATHPFRILKNNYDIFHVLSASDHISLKDTALLLMAKINRTATVLSTYGFPQNKAQSIYQKIQSAAVDAFSCSNIDSLKVNKHSLQKIQLKHSFILPLLPELKRLKKSQDKTSKLKVISHSFNELKLNKSNIDTLMDKDTLIDASNLLKTMTMAQTRKAWRKFQMQHPAYKNCDLILKLEHTLDLFKSRHLILDLSTVTNGLQFHTYFEMAYRHGQFIILTANQASGFPDYWKHQQNCWISDLKNTKQLSHVVDQTQFTLAESFFNSDETENLTRSFENKLNELSRIYSKIISQKNLSYAANKAHS